MNLFGGRSSELLAPARLPTIESTSTFNHVDSLVTPVYINDLPCESNEFSSRQLLGNRQATHLYISCP